MPGTDTMANAGHFEERNNSRAANSGPVKGKTGTGNMNGSKKDIPVSGKWMDQVIAAENKADKVRRIQLSAVWKTKKKDQLQQKRKNSLNFLQLKGQNF